MAERGARSLHKPRLRDLVVPIQKKTDKGPRHGPRILFFSGGTALRQVAQELTAWTHNAIHLITPFDSGGSSAVLRNAFGMPAVGDIRARIMALADKGLHGNDEIHTLFAYRLPLDGKKSALLHEMQSLVQGSHPLLWQVPLPMKGIIQGHLHSFFQAMPEDFSLAGASIGNLILTAGYMSHNRRLNPVIALYSRMVHARGVVRPIVETPAHLAVRLASGEVVIGQHRFSGKEAHGVRSPIQALWLTQNTATAEPCQVPLRQRTAGRISSADLICYPLGSFYSSVAANLLPSGVGRAIAANPCPKVFIPNLGTDPELFGHTLRDQVARLLELLHADAPNAAPSALLNLLLVDTERGQYPGGIPFSWLAQQGIAVRTAPLVTPNCAPLADARQVCAALVACLDAGGKG